MATFDVKITASELNIRSGPSTSFKSVGYLKAGSIVKCDNTQNGWFRLAGKNQWISGVSSKYSVRVATPATKPQPQKQTPSKTPDPKTESVSTGVNSIGLDGKVIQMLYNNVKNNQSKLGASTRLFGSPFQFTKQTDFRLTDDEYDLGRKYMENIVAESPIVYLMPGKPNYLPELDQKQRDALTDYFKGRQADKDNAGVLQRILGNKTDVRYFSFLSDYSTYIRYVNLLCRFCAVYMQLDGLTAPNTTTKYRFYDWGNYRYQKTYKQKKETLESLFDLSAMQTNMYEALFGNWQYTQFYVEPNTSFTESSNNNTTTSKLEGAFDSAEGIVKELAFFAETAAISNVNAARQNFASGMDKIAEKMMSGSKENFFSRLLGMSSTILEGSNLIFPEIWGDAAYNKSYNITINLVSPYGDKESIYLNIIVPLMHILALTLPRQTSANSYTSPFLIKAFAKGWFSCEMGIIDSISIEKGGQGSWSVNGLPTEIRVQLSIKDLYSNLMISPNSRPELFIQNQGLLEFLAVTCGVDISKPEFLLKIEAILTVLLNTVTDIPANMYRDVIEGIRNSVQGLFRL